VGCRAHFEIEDLAAVRERLAACPEVSSDGERYLWRATPAAEPMGTIEFRTVRLTVRAATPDALEQGKRLVVRVLGSRVRHRVDELDPLVSGTATVVTPLPHPPSMRSSRTSRSADSTRPWGERIHGALDGAVGTGADIAKGGHRLPPLGHEAMAQVVPGFREAVRATAASLRGQVSWDERLTASHADLMKTSAARDLLHGHAIEQRALGQRRRSPSATRTTLLAMSSAR